MLSRLSVSNLTVFDRAELELHEGLTVLSGETGAGKTVLTEAIRLICGADVDPNLIGPHRADGYAEAQFTGAVPAVLDDLVDDPAEGFLLARRLRTTASRALVDGHGCSAKVLREAGGALISLTGQHAARRLADPAFQRDLLDDFAGLRADRRRVADRFRDLTRAQSDLAQAREQLADSARREELLRHEVDMVRALDPQPGEDETLRVDRDRLRHADDLARGVMTAGVLLAGDEDTGANDLVARAAAEVVDAGAHDPHLAALGDELTAAADRLSAIARELRDMSERYEADPARLEEIELRLSALADLTRRYGGADIQAILDRVDQDARELDLLGSADEHLADLQDAVRQANTAYDAAATSLSAARRKAAPKLAKATDRHLHELGLPGAKLHIDFEATADGLHGRERPQFSLQANAGHKAAALDRGASGGELSRVNLALLLAAGAGDGQVLIFDEVDAGIGGEVAHILGRKLRELAATHQVVVVTHLAQIAMHADRHFKVEKSATAKSVARARVRELDDEQREQELARLMGLAEDHAAQAASLLSAAAARAA